MDLVVENHENNLSTTYFPDFNLEKNTYSDSITKISKSYQEFLEKLKDKTHFQAPFNDISKNLQESQKKADELSLKVSQDITQNQTRKTNNQNEKDKATSSKTKGEIEDLKRILENLSLFKQIFHIKRKIETEKLPTGIATELEKCNSLLGTYHGSTLLEWAKEELNEITSVAKRNLSEYINTMISFDKNIIFIIPPKEELSRVYLEIEGISQGNYESLLLKLFEKIENMLVSDFFQIDYFTNIETLISNTSNSLKIINKPIKKKSEPKEESPIATLEKKLQGITCFLSHIVSHVVIFEKFIASLGSFLWKTLYTKITSSWITSYCNSFKNTLNQDLSWKANLVNVISNFEKELVSIGILSNGNDQLSQYVVSLEGRILQAKKSKVYSKILDYISTRKVVHIPNKDSTIQTRGLASIFLNDTLEEYLSHPDMNSIANCRMLILFYISTSVAFFKGNTSMNDDHVKDWLQFSSDCGEISENIIRLVVTQKDWKTNKNPNLGLLESVPTLNSVQQKAYQEPRAMFRQWLPDCLEQKLLTGTLKRNPQSILLTFPTFESTHKIQQNYLNSIQIIKKILLKIVSYKRVAGEVLQNTQHDIFVLTLIETATQHLLNVLSFLYERDIGVASEECDRLTEIFSIPLEEFPKLLKNTEVLFKNPSWLKYQISVELLQARLRDIGQKWEDGYYLKNHFMAQEIRAIIVALFEASSLRDDILRKIL